MTPCSSADSSSAVTLAYVEVYLDDFIDIVQGGPTERRKITRHLIHTIDNLFRPNDKDDTVREEPISLKKLRKDNAAWSKHNILSLLETIPTSASRCSWRRWHKLLGTLCSTVPAIPGAAGMLTRLQHALRTARGRWINLSTPVHVELTVWHHLFASLANRPTHLR